jgi:hypothetical protein
MGKAQKKDSAPKCAKCNGTQWIGKWDEIGGKKPCPECVCAFDRGYLSLPPDVNPYRDLDEEREIEWNVGRWTKSTDDKLKIK